MQERKFFLNNEYVRDYKFSILMAVYNVEEYIDEAISTILKQDIGFEENVQLILVDDGSPDECGKICDEYARKYPDNIVVVHKENGGASDARNKGIPYIKGEYVGFLDPDDKYSLNVLSEVENFFSIYSHDVDLVSIPLIFFDAQEGSHILNYKYNNGTRVIDLEKEYQCVQFSLASSFVRASSIKNVLFDTELVVGEDSKEILRILLDKMKLGVISNAYYYYRKRRNTNESLTQNANKKKERYLICIERFAEDAIQYSLEKKGYVPKFVQYTLMYDIQWRLREAEIPKGVLNQDEIVLYRNKIYNLLAYIDNTIIMEQKALSENLKYFALGKKHAATLQQDKELNYFLKNKKYKSNGLGQTLDFLEFNNNNVVIEGRMQLPYDEDRSVCIWAIVNNMHIPCEIVRKEKVYQFAGEDYLKVYSFKLTLDDFDIDKNTNISFYCLIGEEQIHFSYFRCTAFFPVGQEYKNSYFYTNNILVQYKNGTLKFLKYDKKQHFNLEIKLLKEMWKKNITGARKAVLVRMMLNCIKQFNSKKIWLISDRKNKADDNGEALFKYISKQNLKDIVPVFVINNTSVDYKRLQKWGKVVSYNTWKYKLLFLLSDKIISSQADDDTMNPFEGYWYHYRDVIRKKDFIFLQHGVIQNDLSGWLNRYSKNIKGFITSADKERQSILEAKYDYDDENIWLTGLPRHDYLLDNCEKNILVCPTWRQYLMDYYDLKTGLWKLKNGFEESEYIQFYRALLNNERFLNAAQKYGYTITFHPHPNMIAYIDLFEPHESIKLNNITTSYNEMLSNSALLITDYSSVSMDFSYMKKPIIYCQFDAVTFFSGAHGLKESYFDYNINGFGDVVLDVDSTVDKAIEFMQCGCNMPEKYKNRVSEFFAYSDKNNCKRVLEKILQS